ncbi:MAG: M23 family metallopeptidase [Micavibrio aeruginosavorus]|nr:M23 family metallopeptidase [Micavibrio aeruginosavorus]
MFQESRARLTSLFDRVRAEAIFLDFHAQDALTAAMRQPLRLAAAFTFAIGTVIAAQSQQSTPSAPDTPSTTVPKPLSGSVAATAGTPFVDGEEETPDQRALHMDTASRILALSRPTRKDIGDLQDALNGLDRQSGRRDGIFGARTASATMETIKARPELAEKLSPWVLERLMYNGQRQTLKAFLKDSPAAEKAARAMLDNPKAATRDTQVWLAAFGLYNSALDGIAGRETRAARRAFAGLAEKDAATRSAQPLPPAPPAAKEVQPQPSQTPAALPRSHAAFGTPLGREEMTELQTILKSGGYYNNARPTGQFDEQTAGALMGYLTDNQEQLPTLSPWILQNLMRFGHQQDLFNLVQNNAQVRGAVNEKLGTLTDDLSAMTQAQRAEAQVWLRVKGLYNGPVNGAMNQALGIAARDFRQLGKTARTEPRLASSDAAAMAANPDFRRALQRGDMGNVVRMLEAMETAPLMLDDPLRHMEPTSHYGPRRSRRGGVMKAHNGADFRAAAGTPVYAPADGTVVIATRHSGYGNTVMLDHGHGIYTLHAHLSSDNVRNGDYIRAGQKIGAAGSSGRSTGPHLHYEVILRDSGGTPVTINPEKFDNRNLRDPQVRMEAIADARVTMAQQGWSRHKTHSTLASRFPAHKAYLTEATGRRLMDVLATDSSLAERAPRQALTALASLGYNPEKPYLARAESRPETYAGAAAARLYRPH